MPHYRQLGEVPRKRHTQFRRPDGGLYAEELAGAEGFSSDSSLLYHRELPTAIVDVEAVEVEPEELRGEPPAAPRHLKAHDLKVGGDMVTGRQLLLGNDDVRLSYVAADADSPLYPQRGRGRAGLRRVRHGRAAVDLRAPAGSGRATTS